MAWIRTVSPEAARGRLKRIYEAAVARAGRVFNILRIQSLRPDVLDSSIRLYLRVMHSSRSSLSRRQREMIATAVSQANGCHYWTEVHGEDLRAEIPTGLEGDRLVEAIKSDYRRADLEPSDRLMLEFALKLTRCPGRMARADVQRLRSAGFDDMAVHDIVQVTGFFNYYNRLADGLGIEPEL